MKTTNKARSLSPHHHGGSNNNVDYDLIDTTNTTANGNGIIPASPSHAHPPSAAMDTGWRHDLWTVLGICFVSLLALLIALTIIAKLMTLPTNDENGEPLQRIDWQMPSFPPSLADVQQASSTLQLYTKYNYGLMLLGHLLCFMFLQTFAIPGTIFCNLLGGALFGMWVGYPLCLIYNTLGASCLYMLSLFFGRRLVQRYLALRLDQFSALLRNKSGSNTTLFMYLVSLRVFPFTPNWFVNVSAAQLRIPLTLFMPSVFIGLAPYNFLACRAGLVLRQLTSQRDIIDTSATIQLACIAIVGFLIPTLMNKFSKRSGSGHAAIKDTNVLASIYDEHNSNHHHHNGSDAHAHAHSQ